MENILLKPTPHKIWAGTIALCMGVNKLPQKLSSFFFFSCLTLLELVRVLPSNRFQLNVGSQIYFYNVERFCSMPLTECCGIIMRCSYGT